jgi:hypothetical protein
MLTLILLSVTIFIFFILFFGVYFNKKYKQTNIYKNQFIDVHKFIDEDRCLLIPHNLDVVNLGSTQPTFAFDYTGSGVLGMNWAMSSQSFEYDLRILKKYYSFLKNNAFILFPICPFSFFLYRYQSNSVNYKYYQFLEPDVINNYSERTRKLYIDYPIITAKKSLKNLIRDISADTRLELDYNPLSDEEMKIDAKKWENIWLKTFSLKSMDNIILSEENKENIQKNISILNEMTVFCFEKGCRPVIITLPVSKELKRLFPMSFIDEHVLLPIHKANNHGAMILQYWDSERFSLHDNYIDAFLFNKEGRKKFTKEVVNKLFEL